MTDLPLVDVVIPTYNRAVPVVEAVESVISQDYPRFHVHVVDDGSVDGTRRALQTIVDGDRRVSAHRQANRGASAARNRGIAACRGRLLTFLDSDDLMTPGRLSFQVDHLASNGTTDAVVGTERIEVQPGIEPPEGAKPQIARAGPKYYWHTVMLPRTALQGVGGYDESLRCGQDLDLALRMRRSGLRVDYVDRELVIRRFLGDNIGYQADDPAEQLLRLVHRGIVHADENR